MNIKTYFASEDGAISVEWVVITGGLVGLGLATATVVTGGVGGASSNISSALSGQEIAGVFGSAVVAATAALTATSVWDDPNATSREFAYIEQLSFSSVIDFTTADEGIIFESGGTGRGIILYQHDGMLYLQAGVGNGTGPASDRGEASWVVADGTYTIEGSMDADHGLALYVNGTLVDQSSFTSRDLAGGNHGSVGTGTSSVSRNRGNFNANSDGHPGVTEVVFYEDQTTGDEQAPQS